MAHLSGRWYDYLTNPWRRAHMVRVGLIGLVLMVSGAAGIAFVQQVGGGASVAGQTTTGAVGGTFAAGNLLVAVVTWSSSVASPTDISVPAGWTAAGVHLSTGAGNGVGRAYYMPNNAGGAQTWTWNVTTGTATLQAWAWSIYEFSGVATSAPLDLAETQTTTGASSSATHDPGAASGTTQAGDLLISLTGITNSGALTYSASASSVPTAGWNVGTTFKSTAGSPLAQTSGIYQILGAATTATSPDGIITSSVAASGEVFFLTFKAAGAVSGPISGSSRALDQSREYMLLTRRRASMSMPIPPQVNPPMSPARWTRAVEQTNRAFRRRPPFRYDAPIRAQVNPPFDTGFWRRPIKAMQRAIAPRKARRFEVVPPQVNPPMPPTWWTRSTVLLMRALAPRRARRSELPRVAVQANPAFSNTWWQRPISAALRAVGPRRARRAESPWPQQAAPVNPTFVDAWRRRTQVRITARRAVRRWAPTEAVAFVAGARRRLLAASTARRGRAFPPPWPQIVIQPQPFVGWFRRSRRPIVVIPRRAAARVVVLTVVRLVTALQNFVDSVQGVGSASTIASLSSTSTAQSIGNADSIQAPNSSSSTVGGPGIGTEVEGR